MGLDKEHIFYDKYLELKNEILSCTDNSLKYIDYNSFNKFMDNSVSTIIKELKKV